MMTGFEQLLHVVLPGSNTGLVCGACLCSVGRVEFFLRHHHVHFVLKQETSVAPAGERKCRSVGNALPSLQHEVGAVGGFRRSCHGSRDLESW